MKRCHVMVHAAVHFRVGAAATAPDAALCGWDLLVQRLQVVELLDLARKDAAGHMPAAVAVFAASRVTVAELHGELPVALRLRLSENHSPGVDHIRQRIEPQR